MSRDEVVAALGGWLGQQSGVQPGADEDYVERTGLDSFEVLTFVSHCEKTYGLTFTAEELQSPKFRTLAGVAELITAR